MCVDLATGNGQAAIDLSSYFERVIAVEPSEEQLKQAVKQERIEYRCASAENSQLPNECADLVTVAQAMHWFEFDKFFNEVDRILKPHGVLAVWLYSTNHFESEEANRVLREFYDGLLGKYWSPLRKLVDEGYASIKFPFEGDRPKHSAGSRVIVSSSVEWPIRSYVQYVSTWSALKNYRKEHPNDAQDVLLTLENDLVKAFNAKGPQDVIKVLWPMHVILSAK